MDQSWWQAAGSSSDRASCIITTRSGRKHTSVVTQTRGEAADMGDTAESIVAMQELEAYFGLHIY